MNEKEREMELFARSEKREVLKTRYEIERKLRMAKKKEMMQSQTKMRSNERRRNMEEKRKVKNAIKGLKGIVYFTSKSISKRKMSPTVDTTFLFLMHDWTTLCPLSIELMLNFYSFLQNNEKNENRSNAYVL